MKNTTHAAAEKQQRRAEAKTLARNLKKLDRDWTNLAAAQERELKALKRRNDRTLAKASKATTAEKAAIYRRLEILNGRGI